MELGIWFNTFESFWSKICSLVSINLKIFSANGNLDPLQPSVTSHIEISHLIYIKINRPVSIWNSILSWYGLTLTFCKLNYKHVEITSCRFQKTAVQLNCFFSLNCPYVVLVFTLKCIRINNYWYDEQVFEGA